VTDNPSDLGKYVTADTQTIPPSAWVASSAPPPQGWPRSDPDLPGPFAPIPLQDPHRYYEPVRPCAPDRYSAPTGCRRLESSLSPTGQLNQPTSAESVPGRQVLLFHASAYDELTPPIHRAPPGQHAGRLLAHSTPPRSGAPSSRGHLTTPVSMPSFYSFDASAVVHTRSSSRRPPDPLTAGLQPQRSPPRLLTDAACGGLSAPPARRTRRANLHHRHSASRSGDLLHRHHSTSGHTQVEVPKRSLTRPCHHKK
jgi:hypothetical protein